MSRKQKGSKNREKARRKVARLHAKVADVRRDFHHQLSTRLIRENQTVCAETLNVAGLGRSNLAQVDPRRGLGQFTAMLASKAKLYGRTIVRVNRWFPSSQLCSTCGHRDGPKPLKVRTWTCPGCGIAHDRPYLVLDADRFVAACLAAMADRDLASLPAIGAIDQFVDSTDVLGFRPSLCRQVGRVYDLAAGRSAQGLA
jgi:hypothetical protein